VDAAELGRQIEYKVAPEPLLAVQALANTFAFEDEEERLLDPEAARRWLRESDLATPEAEVGRAELERLVAFRDVIRALLDANLSGEPDSAAAAELAGLAAAHPVSLTGDRTGALALDLTPATSIDELISQMIGIVFDAQRTALWPRLKVCAADECRWAFFDSSRNRGGTWCQMEVCGNRIKNRAYRRRRRDAGPRAQQGTG